MQRIVKPRNARSKRALEAREPKDVEDPRTAVFVRGTSTGEVVNRAMKELMALKRPNAISFSKKNAMRPFEDTSSFEFWARKNDASLFVVGQSTKKRPDGLTFVRMFDNRVLDMCEVGIVKFVSMDEFKTKKARPGNRPLMHFASDLFDTHPRYMQLKSLLLDFFASEVLDGIHLGGVEHVISVSVAPPPPDLNMAYGAESGGGMGGTKEDDDTKRLPKIYLRTYTLSAFVSATSSSAAATADGTSTTGTAKQSRVELTPMGPFLDLTLRRHIPASAHPELLRAALRRPKAAKKQGDVDRGPEVAQRKTKERKNVEVDAMGDVRGRIHLGKQDLGKMQVKRMKGLRGDDEMEEDEEIMEEDEEEDELRRASDAMDEEDEDDGSAEESEDEDLHVERSGKRQKAA